MAQTEAWNLPIGNGIRVAIGHHNMIEYVALENTRIKSIPLTHRYASRVLIWHEELLPIIDMYEFLHPEEKVQEDIKGVVIVAYQDTPGESLKRGVVILRAAPVSTLVSTEMGCELPEPSQLFTAIAEACFEQNGQQIPVLKLEQVFGLGLRDVYTGNIKDLNAAKNSET